METLVTDKLLSILSISISCSIIVMSAVQKFKTLSFVTKDNHIWLINILLSFAIGIPFGYIFFDVSIYDAIWVGVFTFIGAPTLYETLKSQTIINYTPKSLEDTTVQIDKDNIIKFE